VLLLDIKWGTEIWVHEVKIERVMLYRLRSSTREYGHCHCPILFRLNRLLTTSELIEKCFEDDKSRCWEIKMFQEQEGASRWAEAAHPAHPVLAGLLVPNSFNSSEKAPKVSRVAQAGCIN
jgi:hypothetical protein